LLDDQDRELDRVALVVDRVDIGEVADDELPPPGHRTDPGPMPIKKITKEFR
jgi:hypothetical protein